MINLCVLGTFVGQLIPTANELRSKHGSASYMAAAYGVLGAIVPVVLDTDLFTQTWKVML